MNLNILVRIVEVYGELRWQNGFRRRNSAVLTDGFCRKTRLRPFRDNQSFAVQRVRDIGVIYRGGIAVPCVGLGSVKTAKGVGGFRLVAAMGEQNIGGLLFAAGPKEKC